MPSSRWRARTKKWKLQEGILLLWVIKKRKIKVYSVFNSLLTNLLIQNNYLMGKGTVSLCKCSWFGTSFQFYHVLSSDTFWFHFFFSPHTTSKNDIFLRTSNKCILVSFKRLVRINDSFSILQSSVRLENNIFSLAHKYMLKSQEEKQNWKRKKGREQECKARNNK